MKTTAGGCEPSHNQETKTDMRNTICWLQITWREPNTTNTREPTKGQQLGSQSTVNLLGSQHALREQSGGQSALVRHFAFVNSCASFLLGLLSSQWSSTRAAQQLSMPNRNKYQQKYCARPYKQNINKIASTTEITTQIVAKYREYLIKAKPKSKVLHVRY